MIKDILFNIYCDVVFFLQPFCDIRGIVAIVMLIACVIDIRCFCTLQNLDTKKCIYTKYFPVVTN